ncbi:cupin domain-containing protein [Kitasatospora sp. RB6PN24]|uniref:cupin domain-containing protein n=1 Tax=Kitasatospora humi TaxID=2893891 RepID=UPI001E522866|nr:cupin domain-containing protein [Kitasatospora humi]MCC9309745.1 cupin domain-containing protein [Kitasatospora humi]
MLGHISQCWNERHWIGSGGLPPERLDAEWLLRLAGASGMHWPYLTLVKSSLQPAVKDFSTDIPGYRQRGIDTERVAQLVADGYTMKYQRLEDFDDAIRAEVHELQAHFGLVTTAYGFITPAESRGLSFHRDASHVVVIQLEGHKAWNIVRPSGAADPNAGLESDPQGEHIDFVLSPGDLLYLPHGWPHCARTASGRSVHLTFTIARPHPSALAAELLVGEQTDPEAVLAQAVHRLGI